MKSSSTHLVLIVAISAISALNLSAQKRFDNPEQKRKVLITKEGPRSTITEAWVPVDSTGNYGEFIAALYKNPQASTITKSDSTRVSRANARLTDRKPIDIDAPKRRRRSNR